MANGLKKLLVTDLPTPTGVDITVTFKHEGDRKGMAIGPVVVTDWVAFERWATANGIEIRISAFGDRFAALPLGATPDGLHRLGWFTKSNALRIAAHYGVGLKES